MIEEIYIRDLGVIQEARLTFGPGLTVITGETGAGKTMVLSALGLLLGERSDSSAIRRGQPQAFVEGRWHIINHPEIEQRVLDAGAEIEDGELLLNRSVSSEGRSRAAISGRSAPINLLSELGESLVVVHGQSDQIRLKSAGAQRDALDQFAGSSKLLSDYQKHFFAWKEASAKFAEITSAKDAREAEAVRLRESVIELEAADVQPGEDIELTDKANRLTHVEELRLAAAAAHEALSSEAEGSDALNLIGQARRTLEQVAHHDSTLEKLAGTIKELGFQLNEAAAELNGYLASLDDDTAQTLASVQERRALISSLIKKYGPTLDDVIAYTATASNRLLELDSSTDRIDELEQTISREFAALEKTATKLTELRTKAAADLASQVSDELTALAMPGSTLVVSVEPAAEYSAHGKDNVSILLSSYAGAEPRPLGKGASGGELSRIMLAIEVVLAKSEQAPTFIFDEVDAGVGGAAAIEVGRRLAKLAKQAQVIVVTHLAQVAAYANSHLRVLKSSSEDFTATDVVSLEPADRIQELTRMLSGLAESESGQTHAAELLEKARAEFN
ncbi:MAG: DNA repair protein RecN [Rhodoluna sp.]